MAEPPGQTRSGWPWDGPLPSVQKTTEPPRITVITPSLNQGRFIEETIRSVLMQGYPNLEYIIIDGGSTDETVEILRSYEPALAHWVSEPDRGQADAINKGLRRATGDIVTWFNSDDVYAPGIFSAVAGAWARNPRAVYAAPVANFFSRGREALIAPRGLTFDNVVQYWTQESRWHDPGLFWSRAVIDAVGLLDDSLRYSFDFDYLARALRQFGVEYVDTVAAGFRLHADSKTISQNERMVAETVAVSQRYWPFLAQVDRRGFERSQLDSRMRVGFSKLLQRDWKGLGALWKVTAERPAAVLTRMPVLVPKLIVERLRRFRSARYF